jgi:hypothetical protein
VLRAAQEWDVSSGWRKQTNNRTARLVVGGRNRRPAQTPRVGCRTRSQQRPVGARRLPRPPRVARRPARDLGVGGAPVAPRRQRAHGSPAHLRRARVRRAVAGQGHRAVPLRHPTDRTTTDRLGQTGDRVGNPAARRCRQPPPPDHVRVAESERYLNYWWYDDGTRLGLDGCLGAADGAVVARALDRVAGRLPDIVSGDGESEPSFFEGSLETRRTAVR